MDVIVTGKLGTTGFGSVFDLGGLVWGGAATEGAGFSASFTYDTSVGSYSTYPGGTGLTYSLVGGESRGLPSPISASLTIGGVTRAVSGEESGDVILTPGGSDYSSWGLGLGDFARYSAWDDSTVGMTSTIGQISLDLRPIFGAIPADLAQGYEAVFDLEDFFSGVTPISASGFGAFQKSTQSDLTHVYEYYSYVNIFADRVTVSCRDGCGPIVQPPAPVPVPAALPLLAAALFGLVALRRRAERTA